MMVLDASKGDEQRHLLEKELEACGIRLNKRKPNIYFKIKPTGGIKWTTTVTLTKGAPAPITRRRTRVCSESWAAVRARGDATQQ